MSTIKAASNSFTLISESICGNVRIVHGLLATITLQLIMHLILGEIGYQLKICYAYCLPARLDIRSMMGYKCHLMELCMTVAVLSLKLPSLGAQPLSTHPLLDLAFASYLTQHISRQYAQVG